jgi:hypothetical protein
MQSVLLLLGVCLLPLTGWSQARTWTFIQDGKMVNDSGATWTFKKNGRIDAALVRIDGTNVILLAPDATYRTLPATSLSPADRAYLRKASGVPDEEASPMAQAASAQSEASKRLMDATRLKNEAAARRRLAQLSLDAADRLDNEVKTASADNCEQDLVKLRNQAAEKRQNAARFQKEAAELERAAHSMEVGQMH